MVSFEPAATRMKIVVVATNSSTRFGGEAILPWHYFRLLRRRGIEAWLVAHERTRHELTAILPGEAERMRFVPDLFAQRVMHRMSGPLPKRVTDITLGWGIGICTSWMQRKVVRELVVQHGVSVVHEPIPVSPRQPSLMYGVGAPVVIGPMNGGMNYPPAFAQLQGRMERSLMRTGRFASDRLNTLMPGKRKAAILLVANERTRRALPADVAGEVVEMTENGVDLNLFRPAETAGIQPGSPRPKFAFVGRLIEWKGVDLLLEATARALRRCDLELNIVGDGAIRQQLETLAAKLALGEHVKFHGFVPQDQCAKLLAGFDALVLPSLYECGGAVVLEAMAMELPVIATKWGGPADYLDEGSGFLIEPGGRESFIEGIAGAMVELAQSPALRRKLGKAGRSRVLEEFDWERKIDRILEIYARAARSPSDASRPSA